MTTLTNATKQYTFATDAVMRDVEATTDDQAAAIFAASEGFRGVTTLSGLLAKIEQKGGYASVTCDGVMIGRVFS